MAEIATIARPYAEAVFRLARQSDSFQQWSEVLKLASAITKDQTMQACMHNPKLTADQIGSLFLSVCGDKLNNAARNFVKLLVENGRLQALPKITEMFEQRRAEQEGVVEAQIYSAYPLDEQQRKDLVNIVENRFKRKVNTTIHIDPGLIGGAKIVVGDEVIDASVLGKLQAMAFALKR